MADRPYTLLSCSMSLDGYLAGPSRTRLLLSNDDDLDRVDAVRAGCDAILVGAATVRNDNPRLVVRAEARRDQRLAAGLPASPAKVTVTGGGLLDPGAQFFTAGDSEKLVYCASPAVEEARRRLGPVASVIDGGHPVDMHRMSRDLLGRGVRRLMVEGGATLHTQFLTGGSRGRAAARRRPAVRRRRARPAVRHRGPIPLESRAPGHPRRRPADR